jgi:hypothetical protein
VVDFRYHLISIVAVFLALGIGILLGSGLLGERLVEGLEGEVQDVQETNIRLQQVIDDQDTRLRRLEQGIDAIEPWMIDGVLQGDEIVVVTFQGVDGDALDGIRASVEDAGGSIASTVVIRDEFALEDEGDGEQLARIIGSTTADADELSIEIARAIGERAASAGGTGSVKSTEEDLAQLLSALERDNFVDVDAADDDHVVPLGADFVIVGGAADESAFDAAGFTVALTGGLTEQRAVVLAAEPTESVWSIVAELRRDSSLSAEVATVDNADSTMGEIASVLALDEAKEGSPGHYGYGDGAVSPLPESTAAD